MISATLTILSAGNVVKIETDHTSIIFEEKDSASAMAIASFADEVYEQIAHVVGYEENRRVPVVLFSGSSTANGSFSSLPSRITMYITSDPDLFLTSRTSWLYSLFVHEMTHFLHLTQQVGPAAFLTPIFGPEVPMMNTPFMSGWWMEGITTYTETLYAPGGRGTSERFLMPVRENPEILPLSKASYASRNPPRGRIYLAGNLLVTYLMENWGEDIYHEINKTFTWRPFFGMASAVRRVTGTSLSDIYSKALERIEAPALSDDAVPITQSEGMHDMLSVNDGTLYIQRWDRDHALSLLSYRDGKLSIVEEGIRGIAEDTMLISPEGSPEYVLYRWSDPFSSSPIKPANVTYTDLYRYENADNSYTAVTERKVLRHAVLSSKGTVAAVEAIEDRYRLVELGENGKMEVLLEDQEGSVLSPTYAPDGDRIAAVLVRSGESSLLLLEDGKVTHLTDPVSWEILSVRFVDEGTLSFTSDRDRPYSLYTLELASGKITRVRTDPVGITDALISGDEIYYQRYRDGWTALFKAERERAQEEVVSFTSPQSSESPREQVLLPFETERYHDLLSFNFWFPYPILETGTYGAGGAALFSSILQRHRLLIMAGYTFSDYETRTHMEYAFTPGRYSLTATGELYPEKGEGSLLAGILWPLYYGDTPGGTQNVRAQVSGRYAHADGDDTIRASAAIGYTAASPSAMYDTLGRFSLASSYSFNYIHPDALFSYGTVTGTTPSLFPHHVISHTLRAALSHGKPFGEYTDPARLLAPESITVPAHDGTARLDYMLMYSIPFAATDIPFLWGGFTHAELSISSRFAAVADGQSLIFEDDFILGAQASCTYTLGVGFALTPFAAVEWAPVSSEFGFRIGIGTDSFLPTLPAFRLIEMF